MTTTNETRDQIAHSIERTLRDEAHKNEIRIAWIRVGALGFFTAMYWLAYVRPQLAVGATSRPGLARFSTLWLAYALALLVALRRGHYRPRLPFTVSFADAAAILMNHLFVASTYGPPIHPMMSVRALMAGSMLLALSGGLRLARAHVVWTTALGVLAYSIGALRSGESWPAVVFSSGLIFAGGGLAMWMTDVVRRSTASEISRALLERFLPRRVIDGAWSDPLSLLGEARAIDATVLVSDLRGFTRLAEELTPAQVLAFLNTVQGAFAQVIESHGGTVDKFLGDGMLAVFGAPDAVPDHARRALDAARGLLRAMGHLNEARRVRGEQPMQVGVGVHSGSVVAGCLGSGSRLEFTVIGDTVNTASRLQALTKEHGVDVLASADTIARAGDGAGPVQRLGEVAVRGKREPLEIYSVAAGSAS